MHTIFHILPFCNCLSCGNSFIWASTCSLYFVKLLAHGVHFSFLEQISFSSVYFSERNRRNYAEEGSLVDATVEMEAVYAVKEGKALWQVVRYWAYLYQGRLNCFFFFFFSVDFFWGGGDETLSMAFCCFKPKRIFGCRNKKTWSLPLFAHLLLLMVKLMESS